MTPRQKKNLKNILIAGALYAVMVILNHTNPVPGVTDNRIIMFLLFLVPYWIVGGSVVRKAFKGMKNKQMFDESFLMFVATIGAFATGEYPEAVAVMLFYQVGEWFQDYAVSRSRQSISDLMDIAPESANLLHDDGSVEDANPEDVEIGSLLMVRPGEKIPLDGVVVEGDSMVNTAALTGESVPRGVHAGDDVISGCINGDYALKIKTTKLYEDSTVARILEMVEEAAEKKSKTEKFITRFAKYYTPIVVFGAIALALIPPIFVGHWMTFIYRACTFLVISCPCAIVVSVPLSFFGGIGAASHQGILVKGSNYLELMAHADTMVFDKTGTLTKGVFKVTDIRPNGLSSDELLEQAAYAESMSTHPIALSILDAYGKDIDQSRVGEVENLSGRGLKAVVDGKIIYAGNARLMQEIGVTFDEAHEAEASVVYVADETKFLGTILVADEVKDDSAEAIRQLKEAGVRDVVMLTGDKKGVAEAVADKLGIDHVYAELLPADKVAKVEELLSNKPEDKTLSFAGDGINDAPVLTRSDVGIAMGSMGSDAAIEAADIVIMDDSLLRLPTVIRIARKTVSIAKANIIFALFVKILILVLGALGMAGMWAAVFADVGVAVICILNAMRALSAK